MDPEETIPRGTFVRPPNKKNGSLTHHSLLSIISTTPNSVLGKPANPLELHQPRVPLGTDTHLVEILQGIGTITTRPELLTGVEDDEKAVSRRLCLGRKDSDEKSERSVGETLRPPELMLSR